jgi:twitching motility two-component system response regulator PilG
MKIAVVEDSDAQRKAIVSAIAQAGFETVQYPTGWDLLAAITDDQPDLVILDIDMPRLNGVRTAEIIKSSPVGGLARIPIIMHTSNDNPIDQAFAWIAGCQAIIQKSSNHDALLGAISEVGNEILNV